MTDLPLLSPWMGTPAVLPPAWGDGPWPGWAVSSIPTGQRASSGREIREESVRDRLMRLLSALLDEPDTSAELALLSQVVPHGAPPVPLAAWLAYWAIERPRILMARNLGYVHDGRTVLNEVAALSRDTGEQPDIRARVINRGHGDQSQPGFAYFWPSLAEPLVVVRAPLLRSVGAPAAPSARPDAWLQVDALEWKAGEDLPPPLALALRRWLPGMHDDGQPKPPVDGELLLAWGALGLPIGKPEHRAYVRCLTCHHGFALELTMPAETSKALVGSERLRSCPACGVTGRWWTHELGGGAGVASWKDPKGASA